MAFAQRLDMRQGQQLVMTPQLQQAIKMLQMSNLELAEYVQGEIERNPLLEAQDSALEPAIRGAGDPGADPASSETATAQGSRDSGADTELSEDRLERAGETFDTGSENLYADEAHADRMCDSLSDPSAPLSVEGPGGERMAEASAWASVGGGGGSRFEDAEFSLDSLAEPAVSLRTHLHNQLSETPAAADVKLIAADLIERLDECGYLREGAEDTAARLGASRAQVAEAIALLQALDPTGVGAADLRECLALQLIEQNRYDPAMAALLDNLQLVADRDISKLRKVCGVDLDDLREMIRELRALDPKPGLRFDDGVAQPVTPDVFVYENRLQSWSVELNADTLPRLLVNNSYAADVKRAANGAAGEVTEYLAECQQNAHWLMKSIDQRAKTILKVASEIVRQQDGFLAYGVSALRPLNLKAVAEAIDMHESTVSRVTSNKYISTPRGVFELKYFFTAAIGSTNSDDSYSAEAIRHRIRGLIDNESEKEVLSDDRLVAILREDGVDIARRTVAKYREAMKIPSSVQRRKEKSAMALI